MNAAFIHDKNRQFHGPHGIFLAIINAVPYWHELMFSGIRHLMCAKRFSGLFVFQMLSVGAPLNATTPDWANNPPAAARVLYSGGWTASHNLGNVNAMPEFGFQLQLVYFTGREKDGLFGSQWLCPQLESSLLPVARGHNHLPPTRQ
jgi:hypothetical protein